MIDFDLNGMSARQVLAYLKRNRVERGMLPNINATEKTYGYRPAVLKALRDYQLWLATNEEPEEEQIEEIEEYIPATNGQKRTLTSTNEMN